MSLSVEVEELIAAAKESLAVDPTTNFDSFIDKVAVYLDRFEDWYKRVEEVGLLSNPGALEPEQKTSLQAQVKELNALHQEVIAAATGGRDFVADQLGDIHKRGNALRAYLNRLPSRISITGRRKG